MHPTDSSTFTIGGADLSVPVFEAVCRGETSVTLGMEARKRVAACDEFRRELAASPSRIYGVNTGFGRLADTVIPEQDQAQLQRNLIRSHAVGWGPALDRETSRGMVLLRAMSLAHGYSGVRIEVIEQLIWLLNTGVTPWIPSRGSVGASGDLAPLSHLALVLMGEGFTLDESGERAPAHDELKKHGRERLVLEAKEGLALINGTQLMNSLGLHAVARAGRLIGKATLAATLSLEALEGSVLPFDEEYQLLRPHPEINDVAAAVRNLMAGSGVLLGHQDCARVQDPYSVRCFPQVIGSSLGVVRRAGEVFLREAGSVTDNPILLPRRKAVITGGHFHGQPLAHQLDFLYQAVSEVANIAERRINLMLGGNGGRLPRFLAGRPGLESGLMIAQYLAAALVTENKSKGFPAAMDSVPTSDGQEDHVSMGSVSALKLAGVLSRSETVVGLELLTSTRALQFITRQDLAGLRQRTPSNLAGPLDEVLMTIGELVDLEPGDRFLTDDVRTLERWVREGSVPGPAAACLEPVALGCLQAGRDPGKGV